MVEHYSGSHQKKIKCKQARRMETSGRRRGIIEKKVHWNWYFSSVFSSAFEQCLSPCCCCCYLGGWGLTKGGKLELKISKEKITSYSSCKRERAGARDGKGKWIDDEAGRNSEGICIECDFFLYLFVIVIISFRFPESCELRCRSHSRFCIQPELHYASLKWLVFLLMLLCRG